MNGASARLPASALAVVALIAVVGLLLASQLTPTIPAEAASIPIAQATLSDRAASHSQQCLDRIVRPAGWLDLCWAIDRAPDLDSNKDYYAFRVHGTVSGAGSGIRWSRVRADLLGGPGDGVFEGWPDGTFEGVCTSIEVSSPVVSRGVSHEQICGRTAGGKVEGTWGHAVNWTCIGCLFPDRSERGVVIYEWVGVPQGTTPAWSIGADFGA